MVVEVHFANSHSAGKVIQKGSHWFQHRDDAAWHGRQWMTDFRRRNRDVCDTWAEKLVIEEGNRYDVRDDLAAEVGCLETKKSSQTALMDIDERRK